MVCFIFLQAKVRCEALESQLVDLVIAALERCEKEPDIGSTSSGGNWDEADPSQLHWQHLSSQLIFFVLFQFASFSHMVLALYEKVCWIFDLIPLIITHLYSD